ncbi:MAG: hypothetical protein JXA20_17435 [Spirochaetes bacterium]|nr:hypothetical protein [Spirochaetota bacterium]
MGLHYNHAFRAFLLRLICTPATVILLLTACSCSRTPVPQEERNLEIFHASPQERLGPTRWDSGNTSVSNENRIDLFKRHIENLGGGYIGVGTTQNFTLAAWARSEWIWLVDYTRITVAANRIHIAFLRHAATPGEFERLWKVEAAPEAHTVLDREYEGDPELPYLKSAWGSIAKYVRWHTLVLRRVSSENRYGNWFTDSRIYDYIRDRALKGRIIALRGDLKGSVTMRGIAENAARMGVTVRVIYLSNAEEFFGNYSNQFIANMMALRIDERSILLRTLTVQNKLFPWAPGSELQNQLGFHYSVMPARYFVQWISRNAGKSIFHLIQLARVRREDGFSEIFPAPAGKSLKP